MESPKSVASSSSASTAPVAPAAPVWERPLTQHDQAVDDIITAITREASTEVSGEQIPPVVPAKDTEEACVEEIPPSVPAEGSVPNEPVSSTPKSEKKKRVKHTTSRVPRSKRKLRSSTSPAAGSQTAPSASTEPFRQPVFDSPDAKTPPVKRTKMTARKSVLPTSPKVGGKFRNGSAQERYLKFKDRGLVVERRVSDDRFDDPMVLQWLELHGMQQAVRYPDEFVKEVVVEFYANLTAEDLRTRKVWVRGNFYDFSADVINQFLGVAGRDSSVVYDVDTLAYTITAGVRTEWKDGVLQSELAAEFCGLMALVKSFWFPSKHGKDVALAAAQFMAKVSAYQPVSLGRLIFSEVSRWVSLKDIKGNKSLPYPCLIFLLLQSQGLEHDAADVWELPGSEIGWEPKWKQHKAISARPLRTTLPALAKLYAEHPELKPAVEEAAAAGGSRSGSSTDRDTDDEVPAADPAEEEEVSSLSAAQNRQVCSHLRSQIRQFDSQILRLEQQRDACKALLAKLE